MEQYFASYEESEKVVAHLDNTVSKWDGIFKQENGIGESWRRNYVYFYSNTVKETDFETGLGRAGQKNEIIKIYVNETRTLAKQFISLITKQRLNFETYSQTEDFKGVNDSKLADSIINNIEENKSLDLKAEKMVREGVLFGYSFLKLTWRTDEGQYIGQAGKDEALFSGDLNISVPSVRDVFYDTNVYDFEELDWVIHRTKKNRWNLIAQHGEMKDELMSVESISDSDNSDSDLVYVYEMYHKPTPAMPKGRLIVYCNAQTVMYDEDNPYKRIPFVQFKPEPISESPWGYTFYNDLVPLQEMLDVCYSSTATNISTFSTQMVGIPTGSDISVRDIGGMSFLHYRPQNVQGGGKPEPINLTKVAPEVFKFIDTLKGSAQTIAQVNAAVRGEVPGSMSGAALAILTSNAIELTQSYSKAYTVSMEKAMKMALLVYKEMAKLPQLIPYVSTNKETVVKEFIGSDIAEISKVSVKVSNPLMSTNSGRVTVADTLLDRGAITTPMDYFKVIDGAPMDEMFDDIRASQNLIDRENEMLANGEQVLILSSDDHPKHIQEHMARLNDPEVRSNSSLVKAITDHCIEHMQASQSVDPAFFAMVRTGQMPQMAPPPQQGPPPPQPNQGAA